MSLKNIFKHKSLELKKKARSEFYIQSKDFLVLKDFKIDTDTLNIYEGYLDIPKGSNFYDEICLQNLIDISNKEEVLRFLKSKEAIKKCLDEYNKQFIKPSKKFFRRYKTFDGELLKDLIKLKVKSKDKYMKFINSIKKKELITKTSLLMFS